VTPLGEVRVKGTLFTVRVDDDGVAVQVFRGLVEVVPKGGEDLTFNVAAGYGANVEQRATFKLSEPKTDALIEALRIAPSGEPAEEATIRSQEAVISTKSSGAKDEADIGAGTTDAGRTGGTKNIHNATDEGRILSNPASMEGLIKKARACLMRRDWECAALRYQEVLGTYSKRPQSASILISLAKIELRHLRHPKRALTLFGTYLERAPNGPLAEDAVLGIADSYRHLGLNAEERKTLRHFVERYPQSVLLDNARIRLRQLEGASL
jgi:TolA-binding protein